MRTVYLQYSGCKNFFATTEEEEKLVARTGSTALLSSDLSSSDITLNLTPPSPPIPLKRRRVSPSGQQNKPTLPPPCLFFPGRIWILVWSGHRRAPNVDLHPSSYAKESYSLAETLDSTLPGPELHDIYPIFLPLSLPLSPLSSAPSRFSGTLRLRTTTATCLASSL